EVSKFAGLEILAPQAQGFEPDRLDRISQVMARAVDEKQVPGVVTVVARRGQVVHANVVGARDLDHADDALRMDSLFRMYSQTKPITAVVAMTLFEDGVLFLDDPISKWLPEFANPRVMAYPAAKDRVKGTPVTLGGSVAAEREVTIFDLMTMTSGMPSPGRTPSTHQHAITAAMEGSGFLPMDDRINDPRGSYEDMVLALAQAPLHAQPGTVWNYGSDFDVLSLLLERASGKPLDELFSERVFDPLGMTDACFYCGEKNAGRLVTDHAWDPQGNLIVRDPPASTEKVGRGNRKLMSGNGLFGGALCTPPDYARFAQMLQNGGTLDGVRIIGRKTVELMTANHIGDRSVDIAVGPGWGFGLGYAVRKGVAGSFLPGSPGTFGWGGAAGTWFFVDPVEEMWGMFFTHVFGYQFSPTADLMFRFEKMAYEALAS
ncbi:MAG: serine hydrolase, partial [Proteobacteria bacterium]|nr:serine hydrolase [Pseudomonadota bacterium]